jgi:hypothetical protein
MMRVVPLCGVAFVCFLAPFCIVAELNLARVQLYQIFKSTEEVSRTETLRKSDQFKQKLEHENAKLGMIEFCVCVCLLSGCVCLSLFSGCCCHANHFRATTLIGAGA